jgi:hypothetical protein
MNRCRFKMPLLVLVVVLVACSAPKKEDTQQMEKPPTSGAIDWRGTWTFTDNAPVDYTLVIGEQENEMFVCSFKAEGVQTAYELDCLGVASGEEFKLYFQGVKDGSFPAADQINRDTSSLTLKRVGGKIVTYWDQFFNNYVEEGNHSGKVCFER